MAITETIRRPGKTRQLVKGEIGRWIDASGLQPGDQIPSQNVLAEQFQTTAVTVHKAMREMVAEGRVRRQVGRGTFVARIAEVSKSVRDACLLMPLQHQDSPSVNPHYWPYVRDLMGAFAQACGEHWTFTVRAIGHRATISELRRFDAVFVHFTPEMPHSFVEQVVQSKLVPVIRLGLPSDDPSWDCLNIDHDKVAGVHRGVSFLLQNGYRRIAVVASDRAWGEVALKGYRQAIAGFAVDYDENLIVRVDDSSWEGARAVTRLLAVNPGCDAVFVDSDLRALGVIDALRQRGLRVPEDVAVMGYDGLDIAVHHAPYLTSVMAPWRQVIAAALQEVERNPGRPTERRRLTLAGGVINGATTARRTPVSQPMQAANVVTAGI